MNIAIVLAGMSIGIGGTSVELIQTKSGSRIELEHRAFRQVEGQVQDLREIVLPTSGSRVIWWSESMANQPIRHWFAISLDGRSVDQVAERSLSLPLQFGQVNPATKLRNPQPGLRAPGTNEMYIVQLVSQPLDDYREAIASVGGVVYNYLPDHAYVCRLPGEALQRTKELAFVRAVGVFEPSYRIEPFLVNALRERTLETAQYNLQICGDDPVLKQEVAGSIALTGGIIDDLGVDSTLMLVTLTPAQLQIVAGSNGVLWIDRKGEPGADMDNVRVVNGANYVQTAGNFQGQGVNAHVIDTGMRATHQAMAGRTTVRTNSSDTSHGSSTTGIVIGNGAGNSSGKGMLPLGNLVFSVYQTNWSTASRLSWTQATVNTYKCVVESNSWGDTLTGQYTSISSGMDEIIYKTDLCILNSMSNWGSNQQVRPQAWAKNIVSIGGVNHFNNSSTTDDRWQSTASIGPAADGRIKPELCFYYDSILCPTNSSDTAYTTGFGGTSAATPMSAGCFGLMYQMCNAGVFGNSALGATVFDNRLKAATSKALMVNMANQYNNNGVVPYFDITRYVQGWGLPNAQNLYDRRNSTFIVDETHLLTNLKTIEYRLWVPTGQPAFRATMSFTDYWATANANPTRINDLDLTVIAPNGTVYRGNNGMVTSAWTTAGGVADGKNNTENVFVQNPASGIWRVQVRCSLLAQDGHPETAGIMDADYGLVVSGVLPRLQPASMTITRGTQTGGTVADLETSNNVGVTVDSTSNGNGTSTSQVEIKTTALPNVRFDGSVRFECSTTTGNPGTLTLEVKNPSTGQWDYVGTHTQGSAPSVAKFKVPNLPRHTDPFLAMTFRVTVDHADPPSSSTSMWDHFAVDVSPLKPISSVGP